MRTVTFSNEEVGKALEEGFVCSWQNRNSEFHECTARQEKAIFASTGEAFTTRNICTFFLTGDLQILHYVPGYCSPPLFLEELKFARSLHEALFDPAGVVKPGASKEYINLHRQRAKRMRARAKEISEQALEPFKDLEYRGQWHKHSARCQGVLRQFLECQVNVHRDLARGGRGRGREHAKTVESDRTLARAQAREPERPQVPETCETWGRPWCPKPKAKPSEAEKISNVPLLSKLKTRYLYGSSFSEERARRGKAPTVKKPAPPPPSPGAVPGYSQPGVQVPAGQGPH